MEHNYEEIVREWYNRLRPEFLRRLTARYSSLTLYDAENLYQDAFLAVQKNIMEGRVRENTSWSSYIMTIGMNLANHEMRGVGLTDSIDDGYTDDGVRFSLLPHIKLRKNIKSYCLLRGRLLYTQTPKCKLFWVKS